MDLEQKQSQTSANENTRDVQTAAGEQKYGYTQAHVNDLLAVSQDRELLPTFSGGSVGALSIARDK